MFILLWCARLATFSLAIVGLLGTLYLANEDGLFRLIKETVASGRLPESHIPLITTWTKFNQLDNILSGIVAFFWPIFDGNYPTLSLHSVHFFGQLASTWLLIILESFRIGHSWRLVSFFTFWGLAMENMSVALFVPLYCFVHLVTSPTMRNTTTIPLEARKTALLIHPLHLQVLPWSFGIGHGISAVLCIVAPASSNNNIWTSKQFWILVRMLHPISTVVVHWALYRLIFLPEVAYVSASQRNRDVLKKLDGVYAFAQNMATTSHVMTVSISLCSHLFPHIFNNAYIEAFSFATLFTPSLSWIPPVQSVSSIGAGTTIFFQWDEAVLCLTVLIWAVAIHWQARVDEQPRTTLCGILAKSALMSIVGGPAAAAVSLIRERDQFVLSLAISNTESKDR